jgi:TRAP-type uncharacterized transport system fused permease subunit
MLLINTTPALLAQNLITACCGMFGAGVAMIGFYLAPMSWPERVWFFAGGLMLIDPGLFTDLIGLSMLGLGVLYQLRKKRAEAGEPAPELTI